MNEWRKPVPYVEDHMEWRRTVGHLELRVQEACKPDEEHQTGWFNWQVSMLTEGNYREDLRFEEGGAPTERGA